MAIERGQRTARMIFVNVLLTDLDRPYQPILDRIRFQDIVSFNFELMPGRETVIVQMFYESQK